MTIIFDEDGLHIPTQAERRSLVAEKMQTRFGANLKVEQPGIAAQLIDIMVEIVSLNDQALLSVYASFDPNGARFRALDARLGLTGSTRLGATHSVADGILTFSGVGTMNNGDLIRNEDNDTVWELTDGPHTSAGPFPEEIAAQVTAVDTGPILANAGTTWSLVTSVSGLDSFTNPTDDAEPGRDQEADGDARTRRLVELHSQGRGPLVAIAGHISKYVNSVVGGLEFVRVFHNPSTFPADADGIPFKAFLVVVETTPSTPTADQQQAIFDAIWAVMGAGGEAYGTDFSGTVVDSEGTSQPVNFDTIDIVDIVLEVDLVTTGTEDPITPNIETVVAEKIIEVATANLEKHGRDVRRIDIQNIVGAMLESGEISGPYAVNVRMAIDPGSPTSVDRLVVGIRERPDFDSGNLTVIQV